MQTVPKIALKFLRWFCREDYIEEVEGDLIEVYEKQSIISPAHAQWRLVWSVIKYLRPGFIKSSKTGYYSNTTAMIYHNILLAIRNNLKYKNSFLINLIGLASGLACTLLIYLWVADELSIDKFHTKDKQLHQVYLHHEEDGVLRTGPETQGVLAKALQQEIPEVIAAVEDTKTEWFGDGFALSDGKNMIKAKGKFSGKDYFNLFSFPFKYGNPKNALNDKSSIVLSESLALKLYGTSYNLIGKSIEWQILDIKNQSIITGIFSDLPTNSSEEFDFVLPFVFYSDLVGDGMHWGNYNATTYVELSKDTNLELLNSKIAGYVKEKVDWSNVTPFFKQYSSIYLHGTYTNGTQTGGRIVYVRLFLIVALFVLAIACINFMNLSTARASRRLKEIGVKKTLGALRSGLIGQYIIEAILTALVAMILAFILVYLFLPKFNEITGKQLALQFTHQLLLAAMGMAIGTGLLAGSYPAFYLSGFRPITILKGKLNSTFGEVWIRKGLVVFQFVLSIVMIVGVLVVYKQIEFVQNKNLGYDKSNVLVIPVEGTSAENITLFLTELKSLPGVINASGTSHSMVKSGGFTTGIEWEGSDPDIAVRFGVARVHYDFIETLGIEMITGRSFSQDYKTENNSIIFNEAAIKTMGLEDPIGKTVNMWGDDKVIIGIVKDFHFTSLHHTVEPLLFYFDSEESFESIMIKIQATDIHNNLESIKDFYKDVNPGYTLEYNFLDQNYQAQYKAEERVSVLSRYFAFIAIIISCLGLFGLAAFTAERRQKEIGIRKILGSGNLRIVTLLSSDFSRMVLTAIIIAVPLSYFIVKNWLDTFALRIDLEWWFFAGAALLTIIIAWLTVGIQTIKTALANPVDCLKDD